MTELPDDLGVDQEDPHLGQQLDRLVGWIRHGQSPEPAPDTPPAAANLDLPRSAGAPAPVAMAGQTPGHDGASRSDAEQPECDVPRPAADGNDGGAVDFAPLPVEGPRAESPPATGEAAVGPQAVQEVAENGLDDGEHTAGNAPDDGDPMQVAGSVFGAGRDQVAAELDAQSQINPAPDDQTTAVPADAEPPGARTPLLRRWCSWLSRPLALLSSSTRNLIGAVGLAMAIGGTALIGSGLRAGAVAAPARVTGAATPVGVLASVDSV